MENLFKRTNRVFSRAGRPDTDADAPITGQGRLAGYGPIGVIDIGSNSVRLVAYERLARALTPLYNEKVLCGLGRGLAKSGLLADDSVHLTLATLARFRHLSDQMRLKSLRVVATAAVREAANGATFIAEAERILATPLTILSGDEEARAAALGVQAGFFKPSGIVGDLGGGSLELVSVEPGHIGEGVSHPLGVIRMQEEAEGDPKRAYALALDRLTGDPTAASLAERTLYLVGGTWRNLAKLHMEITQYPLSVMHGYAIPADEFSAFCQDVARDRYGDDPAIRAVSRSRKLLLPFGAAVLRALFEVGKPANVVLSALGVREGLLFDDLDEADKQRDPLLDAAFELAILRSRSPEHARELADWTGAAFAALGIEEDEGEARLRRAASLLADIGWRAHPDYRGIQSHNIIAHAAFSGIDHAGRLYLATANYYRHQGLGDGALNGTFKRVLPEDLADKARRLGALFRGAYALTASMPGVLPETRFESDGARLALCLPAHLAGLQGERLAKRLTALAKLLGKDDGVVAVR